MADDSKYDSEVEPLGGTRSESRNKLRAVDVDSSHRLMVNVGGLGSPAQAGEAAAAAATVVTAVNRLNYPAATVAPITVQITAGASATVLSLLAALSPPIVPNGATRRYMTLQARKTGATINFGAAASATTKPIYTDAQEFDLLADDITDLRIYGGTITVDVTLDNAPRR